MITPGLKLEFHFTAPSSGKVDSHREEIFKTRLEFEPLLDGTLFCMYHETLLATKTLR